jgi:4-carboxymuconolactone decarboxylase
MRPASSRSSHSRSARAPAAGGERAASRHALTREELRALAALAAAVAAGDAPGVGRAARELRGRLPRRAAEEAVLQTYLFAGFPAAINGLAALEEAWPPESQPAAAEAGDGDPATWRARGERLCARIYGPRYPHLRARMRRLSAALDDWMVVEGYGKTLGRPGLPEGARELCAVAALAAVGAARQLEAHLEGAARLGLEPELAERVARDALERHAPSLRRVELESVLATARGEAPARRELHGRANRPGPGR